MALRNTAESWGWPARLLHWAMALLIVGMLALGFWLSFGFNPGDPAKIGLIQTHKSFGFTVFTLACLRVVWRAVNPTPALPVEMPALERTAARATHLALYVLIIAMPLTGWLMASASPYNDADAYPMQMKNMVFGLFEMPDPFDPGSDPLSRLFRSIHSWCALALVMVLGLHVAGALKHALFHRDGVLGRMISG